MTRFFAVIPQLPRQYLGNYRPLVADSFTRLIVIICYYFWYTHEFEVISQHTMRATGNRHNTLCPFC